MKNHRGNNEESISNVGWLYVDPRQPVDFHNYFKDKNISIDIVALSEFPSRFTFVGDRTLIKNLKRSQWLSEYDKENMCWRFLGIPKHGTKKASAESIAQEFHKALKNEILNYIEEKQRVGILLSGGMDSRIVAGILRTIQLEKNDFSVTVFCWGDKNSRDPIYSEKISNMYGWTFEHFDITPSTLIRNINACAEEGCFYAPNHLHAMPDVAERAEQLGIDCILAGSYGDSIGRAEFSGKKVGHLKPINRYLRNWYLLVNPSIYEYCKKESLKEIERYRFLFGKLSKYELNELNYQLHYMRNQLGTSMSFISKKTDLFQCFTSKEVVELMWSYIPECRTDDIYLYLIKNIDMRLYEIPWARTGKRYLNDEDMPDKYSNEYHKYQKWAKEDLSEYIEKMIFDGEIEKTNVFNMDQLKYIVKENKRHPNLLGGRIDEIILWLASLSIFLKQNRWHIDQKIENPQGTSILGKIEVSLSFLKRKWS